MSQTAAQRPESGAVIAGLHYTVDTGVKPVNETFGPNNIRRRVSGEHEVRQMTIRDGRPLAGEFDLEITGFEFVEHKTHVRDLLPGEAEALLQRRFAIIQVWRATNKPIQSNPLAIADARSLAPRDLIRAERRYPNRVGETYRVGYNPEHRWFYFPLMRRDEALVFKVFDSAKDGRARFTAHSSFVDPTTPPGAPARQSIEARTLAFFDA